MLVVPGVVVAGRNPTPRHPVWIVDWLDASDAFPSWAKPSSVKAGDVELFKKLLEETLALPDDVYPDLIPETKNSKRKAKKLLGDVGDLF